ncbi:MAG: hypothetical protein GWN58_05825, partial [Anaerolineae bacterium]|nr:hypothetical protein [Anaerolineae bacterium]
MLLIVLGVTLALRRVGLWRRRVLWGLRNRLLVTYVFIAVIPILLVLGMVGLTSYLLYGQLAGYLFAHDLERRALELGKANLALAGELAGQGSQPDAGLLRRLENERAFLADEFP